MTECKRSTCSNPVGQQDRDDYQRSSYCSVQCQVKTEKRRHEAKEARRTEERLAEKPERYF